MTQGLELYNKDLKTAIIKMLQWIIMNTFVTELNKWKAGNSWQRNKGYKEEPSVKFRTKKIQ